MQIECDEVTINMIGDAPIWSVVIAVLMMAMSSIAASKPRQ